MKGWIKKMLLAFTIKSHNRILNNFFRRTVLILVFHIWDQECVHFSHKRVISNYFKFEDLSGREKAKAIVEVEWIYWLGITTFASLFPRIYVGTFVNVFVWPDPELQLLRYWNSICICHSRNTFQLSVFVNGKEVNWMNV